VHREENCWPDTKQHETEREEKVRPFAWGAAVSGEKHFRWPPVFEIV